MLLTTEASSQRLRNFSPESIALLTGSTVIAESIVPFLDVVSLSSLACSSKTFCAASTLQRQKHLVDVDRIVTIVDAFKDISSSPDALRLSNEDLEEAHEMYWPMIGACVFGRALLGIPDTSQPTPQFFVLRQRLTLLPRVFYLENRFLDMTAVRPPMAMSLGLSTRIIAAAWDGCKKMQGFITLACFFDPTELLVVRNVVRSLVIMHRRSKRAVEAGKRLLVALESDLHESSVRVVAGLAFGEMYEPFF